VDQEEEEKTTQKKQKTKTRKAQYPGFTHAAYRKQWLVRRKLGRRKNKEKEQIPHAQRAKTHDAIVNATLSILRLSVHQASKQNERKCYDTKRTVAKTKKEWKQQQQKKRPGLIPTK